MTTGGYAREEFLEDLAGVTDERSNRELAATLADESVGLPAWMSQHGVKWQRSLHGALHLARTNAFFLGGGRALLNSYYDTAIRLGVQVRYGTKVTGLRFDGNRCARIEAEQNGITFSVAPQAVVIAAGGIEANLDWLRDRWGDAADHFIISGTAGNDGLVLQLLLAAGAPRPATSASSTQWASTRDRPGLTAES